MIETIARLKPKDQWPDPDKSTRELMKDMNTAIRFPGLANAWTMPIKTRIDMLSTGIKTPVGIKVGGPDLTVLEKISKDIEQAMKTLPETVSAFGDRAVGGYYLDFNIRREEAARYGLTVGDVQDVIKTAIGGMNITHTVEGLERYPINLRYQRELRDNPDELRRVLIPTPTGTQIPVSLVADISLNRGPPVIKSENARPNAWIYVDINTSNIGGFVADAKRLLEDKVDIPPGYTITWSGQFEYMERAANRLKIVIPLTIMIIFLLLYFNFRNVTSPLIVMLSIPFALIGGIWLVYWYGFNLSVAVAVGFIALAGVAAEIGVLVLTFINHEIARQRHVRALAGAEKTDESVSYHEADPMRVRLTADEIMSAVLKGTSERVRPITMTAVAVVTGLLPIMVDGGTGSSVMQRIAAPMVGGMITTTILCLLVLPVIYGLVLQVKESLGLH